MSKIKIESVSMRRAHRVALGATLLLLAVASLLWSGPPERRAGRGQWTTFGHDPQRSGWAKDEQTFSPQNVFRLGLVWKATLPNEPRALNGLTAPLVVGNMATGEGVKALVVVGGSSDHLFALDAETGAVIWKVDFPVLGKPNNPSTWLCPNALNATPVIDAERHRVFAIASDGRLHTIALRDGGALRPPVQFVPPYSKMWSLNYVGGILYAPLSQDCNGVRSGIYAMDPDAPGQPVTAFWTAQNCGRGFCGAGAWGRGGVAIDFSGFIYAATGDGPFDPTANQFGSTVVRVVPTTLKLADYYTPPNWQQINKLDLDMGNTTPVVFRWRDRVLAATGGKEGVIYLMDAESLGGGDHHSAVYVSPRYSNDEQSFQKNGIWGALSSWQDPSGNVWVLVPTWGPTAAKATTFPFSYGPVTQGCVMAFKVVADSSGKPILQPAWTSHNISVPEPVAIAGGIVFALGTGENTEQVYEGDIKRLIKDRNALMNNNAVLFALDGETGRELWNSGGAITDWTHFSGLAVGDGKVFLVTHQGGVYAFGLKANATVSLPASKSTTDAARAPAPPQADVHPSVAKSEGPSVCPSASDLFKQQCAMCHAADGKGLASLHTPDFTDAKWQASRTDAALIDAIVNGKEGEGRMPAFKGKLTTEQADQLVRCVRGFASAHTK